MKSIGMKFASVIAAQCLLMLPGPASADEFKDRVRKLTFYELMNFDDTSIDAKQKKFFDKLKADRIKRVDAAFKASSFSEDPFSGVSKILYRGYSYSILVLKDECKSAETCTVSIVTSVTNACRGPAGGVTFCDFRSAFLKGGVDLSVSRLDFQTSISSSTSQNYGSYLSSGGQKPVTTTTNYQLNYVEVYSVSVPISTIRSRVNSAAENSGDQVIRLSGSGANYINLDEEILIGFLKKFDESSGKFFSVK